MARPLTDRQQQVYEFIHEKITNLGYSPTVREIGDFLGIKSPNGVMCHLRALERKGLILRTANKSRAIELRDQSNSPIEPASVPVSEGSLTIRGSVAKGACKLFDAPQPFDLLAVIKPERRYLLQVNGDELAEYSIADGDMLVVEPSSHLICDALNLVQCPDGSIELKSSQDDAGPAEPSQTDIDDSDAQVIGVVVGILRIHRGDSGVKPPHLLRRKAQRA